MTWLFSCSIPEDQKPIIEYVEGKENPWLNWIFLEKKTFLSKAFLVLSCFSFFFFVFLGKTGIFLSFLLLGFFVGKAFLSWKSLKERLSESRLLYEEGSWFHLSMWEKPYFLLKTEKFLRNQRIHPILRRLFQYFTIWLVSFLFFFFLEWQI